MAATAPGVVKKAIRLIRTQPGQAFRTVVALMWGQYYRIKFKLLGRRVIVGKFFQVQGPLDIRGPGTVIFGDFCSVISTRLRPTTPYTHHKDAVIRFGDRVLLTRTRLGCENRIEVGNDAGLAECWVIDSDFHSVKATTEGPRHSTKGVSKPIVIGPNVWVGQAAMVLKGVRIGENSIVGAGAVVATNVPPDCTVFGNPARVIWRNRRPAATVAAEPSPERA